MFCDQKLKTLVSFCAGKHDTREALRTVRFDGEKAIAANGYAMAITTFRAAESPDCPAPIESNGKPYNVSAETILQAFKMLPKKEYLPEYHGVYVAPNTAAAFYSRGKTTTFERDVVQTFPDYEQVLPIPSPDDTVVSLSGEVIALLAGVVKSGDGITLRIPQPVGGSVTTAIKYTVGNGMGRSAGDIHGLVMPLYNTPEELRNDERIFIGQSDVAEMITLLRERAPENDRVKYWEMKYAQLVKKVDEEEKRDKEVEEEMEREKATAEMEEVPY